MDTTATALSWARRRGPASAELAASADREPRGGPLVPPGYLDEAAAAAQLDVKVQTLESGRSSARGRPGPRPASGSCTARRRCAPGSSPRRPTRPRPGAASGRDGARRPGAAAGERRLAARPAVRRARPGRAKAPAAPETVRVDLRPVAHRPGFYRAELGEECLTVSRQPFYDTARVLIGRGVPPDAVLEAWHAGGVAAAMRASVGEAAKWTVEETDRGGLRRREWRPFAAGAGCPPTRDEAEPVAGGPPAGQRSS